MESPLNAKIFEVYYTIFSIEIFFALGERKRNTVKYLNNLSRCCLNKTHNIRAINLVTIALSKNCNIYFICV